MTHLRVFYLTLLASLVLASCNLPLGAPTVAPPTADASTPDPAAPVGSAENPIVLALAPTASQAEAESGAKLAAQLSALTGQTVVTTVPASYKDLVNALGAGTVHIAALPPIAYLLARDKGYADVIFTSLLDGQSLGSVQFLVNTSLSGPNGFRLYYDAVTGKNLEDMPKALQQFNDKKPCWSDDTSAAGYIVPLGLLEENGFTPKPGAVVQGDVAVVKTLMFDPKGSICQFGVTRVDARDQLRAGFPDVDAKVSVTWRSDPIVPNDSIVFASGLPDAPRAALIAAFITASQSAEGQGLLQSTYQMQGIQQTDDSLYLGLRRIVDNIGLIPSSLVK